MPNNNLRQLFRFMLFLSTFSTQKMSSKKRFAKRTINLKYYEFCYKKQTSVELVLHKLRLMIVGFSLILEFYIFSLN